MTTDIIVPALGESVTEATVAKWLKKAGEVVVQDAPLVELETDKVTIEVNAKTSGVLAEIAVPAGSVVRVGALLGRIDETGKTTVTAPVAPPVVHRAEMPVVREGQAHSPAVRKIVDDNKIDVAAIPGTGKDGRVTKGDVLAALKSPSPRPSPVSTEEGEKGRVRQDREERVPMTRLRQRIAARLKEAQNTAAILTTFNEADMSGVMALRAQYKDSFEKKHGVKLGFMAFFVKAAVLALKDFPVLNAEIDGTDIVYKNHYDIGVAVSTPSGLVVPVVRDAEAKSFAEIEKEIADMGARARDGKLSVEELTGGTFTITNGGVFGSLMSTPIINPPQSAILGMHKIQDRPVAVDGQVVIRPMMYLALSYDHRLVDGREAVSFLVRMKDAIEAPQRLLLDV